MGQSSGEVIALAAVFMALELIFVGLRVAARFQRKLSLGVDDYLIITAAVGLPSCRFEVAHSDFTRPIDSLRSLCGRSHLCP